MKATQTTYSQTLKDQATKPRIPYNLQFFAEDGGTEGDNGGTDESKPSIDDFLKGVDMNALFENEAVKAHLNKVADSRVTKALQTARTKWEQEQNENLSEAEKLAKMTEAQREKYQFDKDRAAFDAERAKFEHDKLAVAVSKQLTQAGLPDLSEYITGKDAETTNANIAALTQTLGEWKKTIVADTMKGGTPPKDVAPAAKLTKEQIQKMTPAEINAAWDKGLIDTTQLK